MLVPEKQVLRVLPSISRMPLISRELSLISQTRQQPISRCDEGPRDVIVCKHRRVSFENGKIASDSSRDVEHHVTMTGFNFRASLLSRLHCKTQTRIHFSVFYLDTETFSFLATKMKRRFGRVEPLFTNACRFQPATQSLNSHHHSRIPRNNSKSLSSESR